MKRITIPHESLSEPVKDYASRVVQARLERIWPNNLPTVGAIGTSFAIFGVPHDLKSAVQNVVVNAVPATIAYKMGSNVVRKTSDDLGSSLKGKTKAAPAATIGALIEVPLAAPSSPKVKPA